MQPSRGGTAPKALHTARADSQHLTATECDMAYRVRMYLREQPGCNIEALHGLSNPDIIRRIKGLFSNVLHPLEKG